MKFTFLLAFCVALLLAQINFAQDSDSEEKLANRFAELIEMLKSDLYQVRKEAAEEIVKLGEPALPLLEKEKSSDDPEVRHKAQEIISHIRKLAAEKRIREALKLCALDEDINELYRQFTSPDEQDRYDLLLRIAVKRNKSIIPALREFLKDSSDAIVDRSLAVLGSVVASKDESLALETLEIIDRTDLLSKEFEERLQTLFVFADLTNPTVISRMALLQHEDARLILISRAVLAPEKKHILFFCAFLSDKNELVRKLAAGGIELILAQFEQNRETPHFELGDAEKNFLLQNLSQSLKSDDNLARAAAIKALGYTGKEEAAEALRPLLQSEEKATVTESIKALGILRDKNAVPQLLEMLAKERFVYLPEIAQALSRIKDESAFEPLLALLQKNDVPSLESAVNALCNMDSNRAAPHLLKLLSHRSESVRAVSVWRLSEVLKSSVALRTLLMDDIIGKLSSEEQSEQTSAAKVIGEVKDPATLPELRKLAGSQDARARQIALLPLAMVGGAQEKQIIEDALKSEDYLVRIRASEALAYLGDWKHFAAQRFITLRFENDSLPAALQKIAWHTGANIVLDPATNTAKQLQGVEVTFTARRKPLAELLNEILKKGNLIFQTEFYAIFVTTEKRAEILKKFLPTEQKGQEKLVERLSKERVTVEAYSEQIDRFFHNLSEKTGIDFDIPRQLSDSLASEFATIDLSLSEVPLDALLRLVLAPRALAYSFTDKGVLIHKAGAEKQSPPQQ